MASYPLVTVIIPTLNESAQLRACIESVIQNGYPIEKLELLIIDGGSADSTVSIANDLQRSGLPISVMHNPKRIQAAALNLGARTARGEIVMRMDAHCLYHPSYIERSVQGLQETAADSVGGIWEIAPRSAGAMARALVCVLKSRFGTGGAAYRHVTPRAPQAADTVPFFCMRREILLVHLPFREDVGPSEDLEFYHRLRATGGKVMLLPGVTATYLARTTLPSYLRHLWRNGYWVTRAIFHAGATTFSLRHLIPAVFVLGIGLLLLGRQGGINARLLSVPLIIYVGLAVSESVRLASKNRDPTLLMLLPFLFLATHLTYGLATWRGFIAALRERLRSKSLN